MQFSEVVLEAHGSATTVYIAGFLSRHAAARMATLLGEVSAFTRTVRVDLSAVQIIDPIAFAGVVRALASWRDHRWGRVMIQFPVRSYRGAIPGQRRATVLEPAMTALAATAGVPLC
jgi:ABC-type transporter Mla MlaB component